MPQSLLPPSFPIPRKRRKSLTGPASPIWRKDIDVDEIVAAIQSGYTITEIARALHCNRQTVTKHLRSKVNVVLCRKRPDVTAEVILQGLETGVSLDEVARHLHCSADVLRRRLRAAGVPPLGSPQFRCWRPDITPAMVAAARRDGMSLPQLVTHFSDSIAFIILRLREAGMPLQLGPADLGNHRHLRRTKRFRRDVSVPAILRAFMEGCNTYDDAARRLRCDTSTIIYRLQHAGLIPRHHHAPRKRPDVTAEDVLACWRQGLPLKAIRHRFHCHERIVMARLREAGIENPRRREPRPPLHLPTSRLDAIDPFTFS